ncbi:diheme cytochrome c [Undibacterium sp. SXout11W]|uniref:diheme cytochrome c n=1 Tax=Undibacterium sp. SXout11W TaxID=3413050 RepID=UPI003BEF766D
MCQTGYADDDRRTASLPLLPSYRQECATCHIAYPPGMLPSTSWQGILKTLPHHYGVDASLDPVTVKSLSTWLTANAATKQERPAEDRITRTGWFIREHDEVSPAIWKLPKVKSASNCIACHTQSDKGDFNERSIHIPR